MAIHINKTITTKQEYNHEGVTMQQINECNLSDYKFVLSKEVRDTVEIITVN